MSDVQEYIGNGLQRFVDEIFEFLRIPSISTTSDHNDETRRAAKWLLAKFVWLHDKLVTVIGITAV